MTYNRGSGAGAAFLRSLVGYKGRACVTYPFTRSRQKGYGTFGLDGKLLYAHRFMCELAHGPAPAGKPQAAHTCGNGHLGCVNPNHLAWASNSENQLDRSRHGRRSPTRRSVLRPADVATIRSLKGIETQAALAKRFDVKVGAIEYWQRHDRPPKRLGSNGRK